MREASLYSKTAPYTSNKCKALSGEQRCLTERSGQGRIYIYIYIYIYILLFLKLDD